MSVIQDALKRAQQERSRRAERGSPSSAPVLVPLRSVPTGRVDRRRIVVLSTTALVGALAIIVLVWRSSEPALPEVPPLTTTILREALADSTSRARPAAPPVATPVEPAAAIAATSDPFPAASDAPAPSAERQPTVVQSGAAVAAASHESRPEPEPRVTSRLRIAVDRPLVPDAARLFGEAVQAHRSGDLATAQSLYERVLALTPNDADALNNLGVVLSAQQGYDAALEHLRRAASLNPRNAATWNNIGTVLREQGHSDEAIAAFRQAISIDPGHQAARIGLAQQYLSTRALDGAKALLEEVLAASPSVAEAHYTLGQVLELQGDRQGAVRSYSAFLRLAPERLASHAELVRRRVEMLSNP